MEFCAHLTEHEEDNFLCPVRAGSYFLNEFFPGNWLRRCTHNSCLLLLLLDYSGYAYGVDERCHDMKREGFSVSSMKWPDITLLPLMTDTMLYVVKPKSLSNGLVRLFIP